MLKRIPRVVSSFESKRKDGAVISAVTLAELEFGLYNSNAFEKNQAALLAFLEVVEVLPFDDEAAVEYGKLCADLKRKGTPIGPMDTQIAAHAKAKGLIAVTDNLREFLRVEGLKTENWAR